MLESVWWGEGGEMPFCEKQNWDCSLYNQQNVGEVAKHVFS